MKADELVKKAETQSLSTVEIDLKNCLKQRLVQMLREEEIKWYQRAKTTKLLYGDCNTKYFHLVANGKHRKTRIFRLDQEEGVIEGDENLKRYITNYYKGLFGPSEDNGFSILETMTEDIPQVSSEENDILTATFTMEEVKKAIFQMEHNKAPGPDGFFKVSGADKVRRGRDVRRKRGKELKEGGGKTGERIDSSDAGFCSAAVLQLQRKFAHAAMPLKNVLVRERAEVEMYCCYCYSYWKSLR